MNKADRRTNAQVLRDYIRLRELRAKMVRDGLVNGDATPQQMIDELRKLIPHDLLHATKQD